MSYPKADIVIFNGSGEPIKLSAIPFHYTPGERTLVHGGFVQRAGKLGLLTEAFANWTGTHVIDLTGLSGRDGDYTFEVKNSLNPPRLEGDWMWFDVMPNGVQPYSDNH
ncbi:hypothetical protein QN366_20110 [Pseudomonas sp. CCC3.2]|uniref:hypothetical protein n=1 Tax=unclassified Pseudomonas TaxID=196821 RepID=UPI002AB59C1F|nr:MULTISPECIES: hypothetical protein [unclassified Pseudomonas]MDY7558965.1 hypothetical protein [Pseudomonas sp. AB6]MEB0182349.1 hypothetical protein [Pseudomonas sp. CCC3.2]MEB0209033.1 hypothetical protein [Pseudomonas sp. AB6]